tara:strand:+ start:63 stop:440 length:378 start_codon:yes stop_codon:yes gene_type:complete
MTRESSVDITQNLRKNLREKFAKFRKSGTPRAQKLRAPSQRALQILHNLAERLLGQHCIQIRIKLSSVQRRDHADFAPNSRERIAKFPKKIGMPRAQKLREVGQRCCAKHRTSLRFFYETFLIRI